MSKKRNGKGQKKSRTITEKFLKKDDICNICRKNKKLSEDHVPPKSCPPARQRITSKIMYQMLGDSSLKPRQDQNGLTYKTICSECNSLLGSSYDFALANFARKTELFVESNLTLPKTFDVECQPGLVIRSILGHLLAAKTETDDVNVDKIFREIVLQEERKIPKDIQVYYWIYPYEKTIIYRDFLTRFKIKDGNAKVGFFSLIKFYPIAFLVGHQSSDSSSFSDLMDFVSDEAAAKIKIPMRFDNMPRPDFPEVPKGNNFLAFGKSASDGAVSIPKNARKS